MLTDNPPKKKFLRKKNLMILGYISLAIILLGLILLFFKPISPPAITFLNTDTDEQLIGSLYLDDDYIGEVDIEPFTLLPKEFCSGSHNLTLNVQDTPYTWNSYPTDCKVKLVTFRITAKEAEKAIRTIFVSLNFNFKDNDEDVKGKLYFNDEFINDIISTYKISQDKCKLISEIKLSYQESNEVSWNISEESCEFETLDFIIE